MSLTLARSEREQNVLTHASLTIINFYFCSVTVSNIRNFCLLVCFENKYCSKDSRKMSCTIIEFLKKKNIKHQKIVSCQVRFCAKQVNQL